MGNKNSVNAYQLHDNAVGSAPEAVSWSLLVRRDPDLQLPRTVRLTATPTHLEIHHPPEEKCDNRLKKSGQKSGQKSGLIKSISLLSVQAWGHNRRAFRLVVLEDVLVKNKITR